MSGPRTLPERAFRQRARLVAVLFCAVAAGLAFRLFWLQLRASDWYTQRALGQQLRDTIVPADRGRIYSCLLYTSPSPRDGATSRMPSSA